MKIRVKTEEGAELSTFCRQLKLQAVDGKYYLTDDISFAWAGLKIKDYKKYKDLKKENLRDNTTNLELVLNMLAETATTEISNL